MCMSHGSHIDFESIKKNYLNLDFLNYRNTFKKNMFI